MMTLHGYFRSSSSYRCRIALNLKGLAYQFQPVHLLNNGGEHKTDAFAALNPQQLVPVLQVGDHVLTQSPAILEWLDEAHPTPALLPSEPFERAAIRAFCAAIACEIHPLQNLRVLHYLSGEFGADDTARHAWCQRWIGEGLTACDALLAARPETRFCFGAAPGLAEVYLIPQVFSAQRFGVDMSAFPRLSRVAAACDALPAFADAHPARQPDAS